MEGGGRVLDMKKGYRGHCAVNIKFMVEFKPFCEIVEGGVRWDI